MGQYAVTIIIAVALVAFVIYQQMRTRAITPRQLVLPAVILAALGFVNLNHHPPDSSAAGVALAASVVTALLFGFARGFTTQVWRSQGVELRKGTAITLALWFVGIAIRLVIAIVARRGGVSTNVTTGELPLFLGVTLAAQNVIIWSRAQQAPIVSGNLAR